MIQWAQPHAVWCLLLPLIVYFLWPVAAKMYGSALRVPFVAELIKIKESTGGKITNLLNRQHLNIFITLLLALMWVATVAALCRPQWVGGPQQIKNQGREIMLVVDISTSMNERDFVLQGRRYDRLSAVKYVVNQFVDKRSEDQLGLVLFGTRAYLQVPLTYDRAALKEVLWATDAGMAGNSTSIGDALGVALKNMPQSSANNRVIVLLTDGENNDGKLSLPQAINLAKQENVKVYTIGVGSDEGTSFFGGLFTVSNSSGLDEESLQKLADETKGTYFRAKDLQSLIKVYDAIDSLEPQDQEGRFVQESKDLFYYPAALALMLFWFLFLLMRKER